MIISDVSLAFRGIQFYNEHFSEETKGKWVPRTGEEERTLIYTLELKSKTYLKCIYSDNIVINIVTEEQNKKNR